MNERLHINLNSYADSKTILKECKKAWNKANRDKAEWKSVESKLKAARGKNLIATAMKYFDINYASMY